MEQMDLDLLVGSPETQMELMNMMLQLQQLAELSDQPLLQPKAQYDHLAGAPPQQQLAAAAAASPLATPASSPMFPAAGMAAPETGYGEESAVREMIFRMAAIQPVQVLDPETPRPAKRRNVRVSTEPQSVAARLRRERISERMRILQHMVPGGTKMDTASMLDEAIQYVKFLKTQVQSLERAAVSHRMLPPVSYGPTPFDVGICYPASIPAMFQIQKQGQVHESLSTNP